MADVPDRPADATADDEAAADAQAAGAGAADTATSESSNDGDAAFDAAEKAVKSDIEELLAEREEFLQAYRRVQADFENYRKQAQKRLETNVASQLGSFVERLLPVLDACDAAVNQGESDAVEPIMTALYGALDREGLERLDPKGDRFDPEISEAVVHLPGEGGDQVVAEVIRPGYRWKGRVLRPALVKVTD